MSHNVTSGSYARLTTLTAAARWGASHDAIKALIDLRWPRRIQLLSESQKTRKGPKVYSTKILYLLPSTQARRYGVPLDLCLGSSPGCRACCLCHSAGGFRYAVVQNAAAWKTALWYWAPSLFWDILNAEIRRHVIACKIADKIPCVRLNGGSDLDWTAVYTEHPDVTFYEYTKRPDLLDLPKLPNVHWTFSATERHSPDVIRSLLSRANVAVVFRRALKPTEQWYGMPVLDGDADDLRFRDPPGHIVALAAKGRTAHDRSGFVRT